MEKNKLLSEKWRVTTSSYSLSLKPPKNLPHKIIENVSKGDFFGTRRFTEKEKKRPQLKLQARPGAEG